MIKYGMTVGSDTAQGRPGDALEYTASAGGAAFILGKDGKDVIARILKTVSFTSDTPDFWRKEGASFPSHGGRFTGEPGYFNHTISATKMLFEETGFKPSDFDYAVFHQPNGRFPLNAAAQLGFTTEQVKNGLITPLIGNTYSGASLIGLAAVLDIAKPGQKILVTSFGSGAGSDSFAIEVTENIDAKRKDLVPVSEIINKNKTYLDYSVYLKNKKSIKKE
jgi:hydroxymethylglutaryl-CoA synthase